MIVKLDKDALLETQSQKELIGVEGDQAASAGRPSEVESIVSSTRQKIAEGGTPAVGISASNSGRGHDPISIDNSDTTFTPTVIEGPVEEEPSNDLPEAMPPTPTTETPTDRRDPPDLSK
jgi:protein phosphatase PTC1